MKRLITICALALVSIAATAVPKVYDLVSPDGKFKVAVENGEGITYTLTYGGDLLIDRSEINMVTDCGHPCRHFHAFLVFGAARRKQAGKHQCQ